jgi:hypothetical protein
LPSTQIQGKSGDYFYFVGIELPHQYVLWAEDKLDKYKREELEKVSNVKASIIIQTDKVRLNELQEGEARPLLDSLRIGNNIKVADSRFIKSPYEVLHLQSISYTWDGNTIMFPNFEAVLSDEVISYSNPIKDIRQKIEDANNSVKIIREESLLQAKKANESINNVNTSIKTLSEGSSDIFNRVNILIGNDKWMSVREIIEDNVVTLENAEANQKVNGLIKAKDALVFLGKGCLRLSTMR